MPCPALPCPRRAWSLTFNATVMEVFLALTPCSFQVEDAAHSMSTYISPPSSICAVEGIHRRFQSREFYADASLAEIQSEGLEFCIERCTHPMGYRSLSFLPFFLSCSSVFAISVKFCVTAWSLCMYHSPMMITMMMLMMMAVIGVMGPSNSNSPQRLVTSPKCKGTVPVRFHIYTPTFFIHCPVG